VGIGNAFFKLGNLAKARAAYERALLGLKRRKFIGRQLDSKNINALVGLALVINNQTKNDEGRQLTVNLLSQAYVTEEGRRSAMTLNQLAYQLESRSNSQPAGASSRRTTTRRSRSPSSP